jgi:calcineurin-like phosphoesterase family protein
MKTASKSRPSRKAPTQPQPSPVAPQAPAPSLPTSGPQFGEPAATPDPTKFTVKHGSDTAAYTILDKQKKQLPRPFPAVAGTDEPVLTLADALGPKGSDIEKEIQNAGQIVFHSLGDTGNTQGPADQNRVVDKMVSDYDDTDPRSVPSFCYHLGDVVYSFGESQYYYDQFYDAYRDYPAPIFAIPGNHDGMVAPNTNADTLSAFLANFCTAGQPSHRTPDAGQLSRTAQIQPGVYFTLEAPFVRILGLYSNCLEDPGVISQQSGAKTSYPNISNVQIAFLNAALKRIKKEKFAGAVIIAVHHPPYVAAHSSGKPVPQKHTGNSLMLADIDSACQAAGVWPHAVISGHAHNYQRFTRTNGSRQTPFVVLGNGGHAPIQALTTKGTPTLRTPLPQPSLSNGKDSVVFENYDDQEFGYLRIIADPTQLRIEYHPATDGAAAKTPDDFVTVALEDYTLVQYQAASA